MKDDVIFIAVPKTAYFVAAVSDCLGPAEGEGDRQLPPPSVNFKLPSTRSPANSSECFSHLISFL